MFEDIGRLGGDKKVYRQGWKALEQLERGSSGSSVPEHLVIEGIHQRALLALRLGSLDRFHSLLVQGIEGARALQSEKRQQEIIAMWKEARTVWPREPRLLELAERIEIYDKIGSIHRKSREGCPSPFRLRGISSCASFVKAGSPHPRLSWWAWMSAAQRL